MRNWWVALLLVGAGVLAVLCFVWPAGVALAETATTANWSLAALSSRRLGLIGKSVEITVAAALLAQVFGAGLACGLVSAGRGWLRGVTTWVCLVVLLTPPYLYTYAWTLPFPGGVAFGGAHTPGWAIFLLHQGRAVWCLATWTAPVAAAILACGWRVSGRAAYRLALLDASPLKAIRRSALALMIPWILLSLTATGVLALTEYAVCHLCLVQTWNTEVLAEVQLAGGHGPGLRPGQALLLAWPMLVLVGIVGAAWWPYRRTIRRLGEAIAGFGRSMGEATGTGTMRNRSAILTAIVTIAVLLLPWAAFVAWLREPAALLRTWHLYPDKWSYGLRCAGGAVLAALWLALGVDYVLAAPSTGRTGAPWRAARGAAWVVLILAAVAAAAPPALVGDAFLAAYLRIPIISDHWPIVSLVTAARFGLLALVMLRVAGRAGAAELARLAETDGASWPDAYWRVRLPSCVAALLFAGLVVGLLSFTELAASSLVCPAGMATVALTLLNQLHYGRDADIIAMSLYVLLFVAVVAGVVQWAWSRLGRRNVL